MIGDSMETIKRHSGQDVVGLACTRDQRHGNIFRPAAGVRHQIHHRYGARRPAYPDQSAPRPTYLDPLLDRDQRHPRDGRSRISGRKVGRDDKGMLRSALSRGSGQRHGRLHAASSVCRSGSRIASMPCTTFCSTSHHTSGVWLATAAKSPIGTISTTMTSAVRFRASAKASGK